MSNGGVRESVTSGAESIGKHWKGRERKAMGRTALDGIGREGIGKQRKGAEGILMQTTERWPVDFDLLQKGDTIAMERIETWAGVSHTDAKYPLELLGLRELVEQQLRERGVIVTVKADHGSLRVLTDPEASEWNDKRQRTLLGQFARTHQRLGAVDIAQLGPDDLPLHERRLIVSGLFMSAFVATKKEVLRLFSHKRKTPGLPGPPAVDGNGSAGKAMDRT